IPQSRLIIEIDGPIHDHQPDRDRQRQAQLETLGYIEIDDKGADRLLSPYFVASLFTA
ncbi:MAG: DUF559 domain-containing protein, partial [Leptolyngbya sp. SIO4C5]|nr:DUF559 domain-containing protein [Leptolyngbya sp. SIO4C5]